MANRDIKRNSMSLIIREMRIKSIMRYDLTPVRMAIINTSTNNKCWQGCRKRGTLLASLVEMQIGAATVESSMEIPQNF